MKAVNRLPRSATARATRRSSRVASNTRSRRSPLERCEHGLLRATCAICLQMEETVDLTTGRLAPDERPARVAPDDEEVEEEE
jgi:hypothetical protein